MHEVLLTTRQIDKNLREKVSRTENWLNVHDRYLQFRVSVVVFYNNHSPDQGRSQNLKHVSQNFMKVFNFDDVTLTS